jgi:PAS domain S-box-containing protein
LGEGAKNIMMYAYFILLISIPIQFVAAVLALRLVWITKRTFAWTCIAVAIVLMALRRCFTLYEWYSREMFLLPVDIGQEIVGLATTVFMLMGVAFIAPLFFEIKRSEDLLRERVEERTTELNTSYQALQAELAERQQAEEALRKSEEKFRMVADFNYDWEYWVAPDGSYNYMSPSCERITGYGVDDFMQDPALLGKITHPDERELVLEHIRQDLAGSKVRSLFFRILTRSGKERWISHICQPVYSSDGRHLGRRVSNRDITKYKQAEEEKANLESQLRQAQKMEAIGTLAGGIAHDFNNILTPIIMFSEIAQRELDGDSPIRPYLDQVLKSSKRASDLVKQILSISRQTERKPVFMELGPLVKESLKLLRASLPATIEIQQDINPEEGWIVADPTEIYQVVMNLCTNAAHAMEDTGGVLGVRLKNISLDQPLSAFGLEIKAGTYLSLAVRDSGHGIPPEIVERIFEPYFTTKDIGEGTGLGLALVHSITMSCGGGIDVVSEPGKGTTIQIFFPVLKNAELTESEPVMPLPEGRERILLVDDEPDIVAAARIILEKLGYQVESYSNGQEALEAFWADPDRFDLVFTDQTMPQLTGVELAQEIVKVRPHLPIIICTGFSESFTPEQIRELGIGELLMKPLTPHLLAEAVRRGLDAEKKLG